MPIAWPKNVAVLGAAVLFSGTAPAAIDWGAEFQEFTGPACWATPIEGGNMAWTFDEPHFQITAGGPVLMTAIVIPKEETGKNLVTEADRAIRASADAAGIAVAKSTITMIDLSDQWKWIVAVPVMPGANGEPDPAGDVKRVNFPPTKVIHLRHRGDFSDLRPYTAKMFAFLDQAKKNPDRAQLEAGKFLIVEYYSLEDSPTDPDAITELCLQLK